MRDPTDRQLEDRNSFSVERQLTPVHRLSAASTISFDARNPAVPPKSEYSKTTLILGVIERTCKRARRELGALYGLQLGQGSALRPNEARGVRRDVDASLGRLWAIPVLAFAVCLNLVGPDQQRTVGNRPPNKPSARPQTDGPCPLLFSRIV